MARTENKSMRKEVGYTLKFEIEFSGSFVEHFKQGKLPLSMKASSLSRELFLTVFHDYFNLSNNLGFQITFNALENVISLDFERKSRHQIISSDTFLSYLKSNVNKATTHKIGSSKNFKIGSQALTMELHHLYVGDLHYSLWLTKDLPYPGDATEIMWRLMLGNSPPSPLLGIPVKISVTDPKNPEGLCYRCELVDVDKASLDKKSRFKPAKYYPSRQSQNLERTTRSSHFSRTMVRKDIPTGSGQKLARRKGLHWSTGRYLTSSQSNRYLGVALNDGFLDRSRQIANSLSDLLSVVSGSYNYEENALEIDVDLVNRLQHRLAIDSETWEIQKDLIVFINLILGGYPFLQSDDVHEGLTDSENSKYKQIEMILDNSYRINNWQWQLPESTEIQLRNELTAILVVITFELAGGTAPVDPSIDPMVKRITLVLMLGFLRESTLGTLWGIVSTFNETILPYGHPRASGYVQAHLGELLNHRLSIPHQTLGGNVEFGLVGFDFGPILNLSFDFSQADLVTEFQHDDTELDITSQIPYIYARVAVNVRLRNKEAIILAAMTVDPTLWALLLLEDSGSLLLGITNTEFPLECRLPETDDIEGHTGLGLQLSLISPEDESIFEDMDLNTQNLNDALIFFIRENQQRIEDELSDGLQEQVEMELSRLFVDHDRSASAGSTIYDKLLPWPDIIKLLNGPTLRSLETDTLSEKVLWAALANTSILPLSSPVGPLSLDDVDEIAYLFPEAVLSSWVSTQLNMLPGLVSFDEDDWASGIGISLPNIYDFPEPPDAIYDEEIAGILGLIQSTPFTEDDQQVPALPECAQNRPMVAPPVRFYRFRIERYRPRFQLPEGSQSAIAGEIIWYYEITLDAILQKEIAQLHAVEGGLLLPEVDDPPKQVEVEDDRPPITSGQETGENGALDIFPSSELDESEDVGFDCYWTVITREYLIERMVKARVELRGDIQLGFTPQNGMFNLEADPLTSLAPTLGLALAEDNGVVCSEIISLETGDVFDETPQDALRAYIIQTCLDDANSAINTSSLRNTQLSGLHYFFRGILGSFGDMIVPAVRDIRLRQQGADVQDDMLWNPDVNEFSYFIQNGRLIWPIVLDFDLDSLIE